ncbi:hypothetical protein [Rhizobium sp.]
MSIALSGAAPTYAAVPALRFAVDGPALSSLLLKAQSVDPGDPDGGDNNGGGNNGGQDKGGRDGRDHSRNDGNGPERNVRNERLDTERIVQDILSIKRECSRYDDVYRIDCLRQGIDMTIANMSDRPENRDAKKILRRASRELAAIVKTYQDDDAAVLEVPGTVNPRFKKRRTYHAVKKASLPRAMARANAVVEEAATQLLRSAENSERRYAHYQQISAAVDSTKTLLRSG